ncbi:MAG TPA: aldehyde dehydrogenase family protein [Thermoplasmata archaeon]|nr:aldehyde dehydrogenase family protein [Thermoplasmata archaeon]
MNPFAPGLFLDNRFHSPKGRPRFPVVDPATGRTVGSSVRATAEDARAAMDSAARAQPGWEALGGRTRAALLRKAAERLRGFSEELAHLVTLEMGKVLYEARGEVAGAVANFDYYANYGETLTSREVSGLPLGDTLRLVWLPRGVVVAITPWNFPAATVTRKIAPALVGGNTVVLKPSSATPLSALLIARAVGEAGLPDGVLNVVTGPGAELSKALLTHPACSTVTLTGSTESGIEVLKTAAPRVVKCLLELGGKAPVLVADDADLARAARATVFARFWNAGQSCIAAERAYVPESVESAFVGKLRRLVESLRVGPGSAPGVDLGPLYSAPARDAVAKDVTSAVEAGAKAIVGGRRPSTGRLARGAFYLPTVLTEVGDRDRIAREEIFGPVLPVLRYTDFDEAIARANASRFGLSSYVFTESASRAERAVRGLRFGETYINRAGPESPQGYHAGLRESGLGGEGSLQGVEDYLALKSVYVDSRARPSEVGYFPYSSGREPAGRPRARRKGR